MQLLSSDSQKFIVDSDVAFLSQTIKNIVEDAGSEDIIPLPNVTGQILAKVIEYCKYHVDASKEGADGKPAKSEDEIQRWDRDFISLDKKDLPTLFDLTLAANYLNIDSLLDLTTRTLANMIKGKSAQEIRETFNIENDLTPDEEEKIRSEIKWVFD